MPSEEPGPPACYGEALKRPPERGPQKEALKTPPERGPQEATRSLQKGSRKRPSSRPGPSESY
eukprot:3764059-Pyramimonas_sp.AAC.1